jgi:hypothetical protein
VSARKPNQAIAEARETRTFEEGHCLVFVRTMFNVPAHFPSAAAAWQGAEFKHRTKTGMQVPRGAPVYWTGGSQGFGHIAIATGDGRCWSSDAGGPGRTAKVSIDELTDKWNLSFQGWTEDVNTVRVFAPRKHRGAKDGAGGQGGEGGPGGKDRTRVRLQQLRPNPRDDVREVQRALRQKLDAAKDLQVDGYWTEDTQKAYAAWQRRCGFAGDDADGVPGRISLQRLGFAVA